MIVELSPFAAGFVFWWHRQPDWLRSGIQSAVYCAAIALAVVLVYLVVSFVHYQLTTGRELRKAAREGLREMPGTRPNARVERPSDGDALLGLLREGRRKDALRLVAPALVVLACAYALAFVFYAVIGGPESLGAIVSTVWRK